MPPKVDSEAITRGIRVHAVAKFMPEHSAPDSGRYMYTYQITITNEGDKKAQLISRHWIIIDSNGKREDVYGPGVVGETPVIDAGEKYSYHSFCPLGTDFGTMEGSFQMVTEDGDPFEVIISRFYLAANNG